MHLWRYFGVFALCLACTAQAAVVYKWTDSNGVVHFSDQPEPGAEKILTAPSPGHGPTTSVAEPKKKPQETPKPPSRLGYSQIAIASPTAEQAYFSAPVPVRLSTAPALLPSHTLSWYLNGELLDNSATQFVLEDLPRGTYTLFATVTNLGTQESTNSDTVTFYVRQPSVLSPQYPKK
jgi:hypothetical protein